MLNFNDLIHLKKLIYGILSAMLFTGCTSDEPVLPSTQKTQAIADTSGNLRSIEEVLEISANASNMITPTGDERGLSRGYGRVIDCQTPVYHIGIKASRSGGEDTLMYVVNYADNNGFALVSAPRNAPELLAVTEKGHYNPSEPVEIEGFNLWMDETLEILKVLTDLPGKNTAKAIYGDQTKIVRDTVWQKNIPPRVDVLWGQSKDDLVPNACEGMFCDNGVAGCANTAMAMIMYFLNRPQGITLTYLSDRPYLRLSWEELSKYLSTRDNPLNAFPVSDYPIRENLAHLLRELGHRANSDYSDPKVTKTSSDEAPRLLRTLSLASTSGWETGAGIRSYDEIFYHNRAILLERGNETDNSGHQWICDGLKNYKIFDYIYDSTDNGVTWQLSDAIELEEYYLIHYNWGWHGKYNGFFHRIDLSMDPNDIKNDAHPLNRFKTKRQIIPIIN